jgi:hypothetical protein
MRFSFQFAPHIRSIALSPSTVYQAFPDVRAPSDLPLPGRRENEARQDMQLPDSLPRVITKSIYRDMMNFSTNP